LETSKNNTSSLGAVFILHVGIYQVLARLMKVHHVQGWFGSGFRAQDNSKEWHAAVQGYICVAKTPHQRAYMSVSVIHVYGTSMDGPFDRSPCTRLGTGRFSTKYMIRGCTRLHLCGQNTSPACMHECKCHTYVRNEYGWSTRSFTLYKVGYWPF
jgi:hypothetical protein